VKKTGVGYCFIGIGHKEPGGGRRAVWSARRGQQALAPCCLGINRVLKIKNEEKREARGQGKFTVGLAARRCF
jgi:hypothetical protein